MEIRFSPDTVLEELAARYPETHAVLERFGIESCHSARSRLAQVCRDHRLSYAEVALALTAVLPQPVNSLDWSCRPLSDLTSHVVSTFHEPVRRELARVQQIAARVQGHGNAHRRALIVILTELTRLRAELEPHMRAEERELFPLIETLGAGEVIDEARGRYTHLRAAVEAEHVDAAQTLRMFEQVTDGYRPPKDACSMVHELYRGLEELQQLERLHAAFERDFLFRRASSCLVQQDA